MSTSSSSDAVQEAQRAQGVADYLRRHPEFFVANKQLLADLVIPHDQAQGSVSLVERQVAALRDQNRELRRQLHALVRVARDNDQLTERMQALSLALILAPDPQTAVGILRTRLHEDFGADVVSVVLFRTLSAELADTGAAAPDLLRTDNDGAAHPELADLLKRRKPVCGHLRQGVREYVFGTRTGEVGSAAVLPLPAGGDCVGLLGIGSRDEQRYHAGMGTQFLTHMAEIIGCVLQRHFG